MHGRLHSLEARIDSAFEFSKSKQWVGEDGAYRDTMSILDGPQKSLKPRLSGVTSKASRKSKQWVGKSGAFTTSRKLMGLEAKIDAAYEFTDPRPRNQQGMFADSTEAGANPDTMRKAYGSVSTINPDILKKLKRKLPRADVASE